MEFKLGDVVEVYSSYPYTTPKCFNKKTGIIKRILMDNDIAVAYLVDFSKTYNTLSEECYWYLHRGNMTCRYDRIIGNELPYNTGRFFQAWELHLVHTQINNKKFKLKG